MGILIPDMAMPISCFVCPLNRGEKRPEKGQTVYCRYSNGVIRDAHKILTAAKNNMRLPGCQLLEFSVNS